MKERPERTRQADCQTSSMSELPKQTRCKQKLTGKPFSPAAFVSSSMPHFVKLYFSPMLFSLVIFLSSSWDHWTFMLQDVKMKTGRCITSILLYFLDLAWLVRWLECVVMVMGGAWGEEREDHIEERSNCQPPGPQDSEARQRDSWPMGYLTEGRRSNSRMKILLMFLPMAMHQVVLSQSCTKNIPAICFEWKCVFLRA